MRKKLLTITGIILVIFFQNSCSLVLNNKNVWVTFDSFPSGATIYLDGVSIGKTPLITEITPSKSYQVVYNKDRFWAKEFTISPDFRRDNLPCTFDVLGSFFIVPILGATSTKCRSFDDMYIESLQPKPKIN